MKINENNIIERLRRGEEDAFRYIYDTYYGYLCAIAKGYLSDNEAAETVVGDVIYNIWEMRENLNIHTSLRSYLIRSVKNRSINYLQQEYISKKISINSLPEYTEIESFYFIEKEHPLEKVLESELEKTIAAAIGNLPEECRTAFILSRIYNKKYDEIADQMGISVNTVKYHIKNALSKLRLELKDYLIILLLFLFSNFIT
ncbi:MAG TPA: RNA polymerase sigma-70 factor [Candidatus Barnesiella excrementigallinarum]|nr:RNA polymerase sigma-70 factor [Candidatus Barnesiella excrementigallinarum]